MSTLTKVFIVLQLIFSIGLAVVVVFAITNQKDINEKLKQAYLAQYTAQAGVGSANNNAETANKQLQEGSRTNSQTVEKLTADLKRAVTDLSTAKAETDVFKSQLDSANTTLAQVSSTLKATQDRLAARETEVDKMRPEFAKLREQKSDLEVAVQRLQNQNDLAAKAIKTLQETIAEIKDKPEVTANKVTTNTTEGTKLLGGFQAPVEINGKVTQVQAVSGKVFLTLSLGTRDKVQAGTKFTVYRGNTYVADAQVEQVTPDQSVAVVNLTAKGLNVQAGDLAKSGS